MAIGAFDTSAFDGFTYLVFFFASIGEVIILLSLLIAIIIDSFEEVKANAVVFAYRERA